MAEGGRYDDLIDRFVLAASFFCGRGCDVFVVVVVVGIGFVLCVGVGGVVVLLVALVVLPMLLWL